MRYIEKENEGKFIKIRCGKCKNIQIIYGKPSTLVKCIKCSIVLVEPKASKGKLKGKVLSIVK